jgi:hypothetical protein
MFQEGGYFMYLVLAVSFLHAIPVLAQFIACKKADFSGYLWAGLAGILLAGWLGTMVGGIQAFEAIAVAHPDQKGPLMAMGAAIALYPTILAVAMVIPGVFFTGIAASLARNLAPRRARKPQGGAS